ncbi:hypothetical protein [Tepidibacillus marianensis]|uniref:hypothetical protein n=1 Tax=Tepidibacillus marianensis TaxID=3131995 RepID=UPI0030CFC412
MRKKGVLYWVLLILFLIGVFESVRENPARILIPLLVFGGIYYFYKNPERLYRLFNRNVTYHSYHQTKKKKRKILLLSYTGRKTMITNK